MDWKSVEEYFSWAMPKLQNESPDVHVLDILVEMQWQYDATKYSVMYTVNGGEKRVVSYALSNAAIANLYHSVSKNDLTNSVIKMLAMSVADDVAKTYKTNFAIYQNIEKQITQKVYPWKHDDKYSIGWKNLGYSVPGAFESEYDKVKWYKEHFYHIQNPKPVVDPNHPSELSKKLPGMDYQTVCPVDECPMEDSSFTLYRLIQHLNDFHKWTREGQIADYLDKLHDDGIVDLSFKAPDN